MSEFIKTMCPKIRIEVFMQEARANPMNLSKGDQEKIDKLACDMVIYYLAKNRDLKKVSQRKAEKCRNQRIELLSGANLKPGIRETLRRLDFLGYQFLLW